MNFGTQEIIGNASKGVIGPQYTIEEIRENILSDPKYKIGKKCKGGVIKNYSTFGVVIKMKVENAFGAVFYYDTFYSYVDLMFNVDGKYECRERGRK